MVKVIENHCHLLLSNIKGVGSIPSSLNEALRQGSTHRLFRKKIDDGLKARLLDITLGFEDK